MIQLEYRELLNAGVHFGHLTRKWNPQMAPFIFMKRNGIHIIDLHKTIECLKEAAKQLNLLAKNGKKIMFVATKKQAKEYVAQEAKALGMPYMTERWLGGTLTNFSTIRKLLKKMASLDKTIQSAFYKNLAKKEKLMIVRSQEKLNKILQGVTNMTRLPAALFVIDISKEHIAINEAKKLGIPIFALTDTNTNPNLVDYPIPSNDDALRSIKITIQYVSNAIKEGIDAYKKEKMASIQEESSDTAEKKYEYQEENESLKIESITQDTSKEFPMALKKEDRLLRQKTRIRISPKDISEDKQKRTVARPIKNQKGIPTKVAEKEKIGKIKKDVVDKSSIKDKRELSNNLRTLTTTKKNEVTNNTNNTETS